MSLSNQIDINDYHMTHGNKKYTLEGLSQLSYGELVSLDLALWREIHRDEELHRMVTVAKNIAGMRRFYPGATFQDLLGKQPLQATMVTKTERTESSVDPSPRTSRLLRTLRPPSAISFTPPARNTASTATPSPPATAPPATSRPPLPVVMSSSKTTSPEQAPPAISEKDVTGFKQLAELQGRLDTVIAQRRKISDKIKANDFDTPEESTKAKENMKTLIQAETRLKAEIQTLNVKLGGKAIEKKETAEAATVPPQLRHEYDELVKQLEAEKEAYEKAKADPKATNAKTRRDYETLLKRKEAIVKPYSPKEDDDLDDI